jgi:mannosyltransferase OCH1-like enzyme
MIAETVNYVWVGGKMPEHVSERINKSKANYPDAKFIYWDNDKVIELLENNNFDFLDYAMKNKKWAHVSDFVKTYALLEHGGFVMDCDNIILKPLSPLRNYGFVSGFENFNNVIYPITAIMGATKQHPLTKAIFSVYLRNTPQAITSITNTLFISHILCRRLGFEFKNCFQINSDIVILPSDYLCGPEITENTLAIHLFDGSWVKNYTS